ncbi:hypothetical protein HDV00_003776 [Rhizophlyctis rosea]|nr:hypothetical protein HDV00_003776 [Rhizophlyctis rosea]
MSLDHTLTTIQCVSGLAFSSFTLLHLSGHALATIRFSLAETALYASREFYQAPWIEPLLIGGSVGVHAIVSIIKVARRKARQAKIKAAKAEDDEKRLQKTKSEAVKGLEYHRYSGYILTTFFLPHVYASRINPLRVLPDPYIMDLTYVTWTMHYLAPGVFHAYYLALGTAGLYHTLFGINQAVVHFRVIKPTQRPWTKILGGCTAIMASTILAISGAYETISMPLRSKWIFLHDAMMGSSGVAMG